MRPARKVVSFSFLVSGLGHGRFERTGKEAVQLHQELQVDIVALGRLAMVALDVMAIEVDTCRDLKLTSSPLTSGRSHRVVCRTIREQKEVTGFELTHDRGWWEVCAEGVMVHSRLSVPIPSKKMRLWAGKSEVLALSPNPVSAYGLGNH